MWRFWHTSEDRTLAYEMACAICEASGSISAGEDEFLTELRDRLALAEDEAGSVDRQVDSLALAPTLQDATATDSGSMILKYVILNGALNSCPKPWQPS